MIYNKSEIVEHIRHVNIGKGLLMLLMLLFVFSVPADAKKDKTNKKKKTEVAAYDNDPDPICRKAKPDSHPRPLEEPFLFFSGGGGKYFEGIDISHYQGKIDWATVATDSHAGFVYLKITEGLEFADHTYQYNIDEARRHGLKVGSYHFFRPNTSAREQFANFKRNYDPSKQDLLPVVDVEVMPKGISKSKFDNCLEDLLVMMEREYGKRPIIYTGKNFYDTYFYGTKFVHTYKFWIAAYAAAQPVLKGNDDYLVWQYSPKGTVKGIRGYVDLDKFVGRHSIREISY